MSLSNEAIAIEKLFFIQDKDTGAKVPFILKPAQRFFDQEEGKRILIAKARQLGFSSIIGAKFGIRCLGKFGTHAVVMSHEAGATQRLLDKVHFYLNYMNGPRPTFGRNSRNELYFPKTESSYYIGTAGSKAFGRGDWISDLHCCIHPNTWVLNSFNKAVHIKEIGVPTLINYTGKVVKITPWMCPKEGIILTPEHKVLTQRGLVKADEITLQDSIVYKKRVLTRTKQVALGDIPLTYEFGRVCGLYFAKGSLGERYLSFGLHEKEEDLVTWLQEYFGDCVKSKGIEVCVMGAKWVNTFYTLFYSTGDKTLPDWIFDSPLDFISGVIEGFYRGDGWGTVRRTGVDVGIGQVRSQLIFQLRDLLCSMGFGFGSVKEGTSWTLMLSGESGKRLANFVYGLKIPPCKRGLNCKGTPRFAEFEDTVQINLRTIEYSEVVNLTLYDLLNQPEGLIKTPFGLISNSEYAWWEEPERHAAGLFQAVPYSGRIIIESTGNGRNNDFYYLWEHADNMGYKRIFFPWFASLEYSLPLSPGKSWKPDLPKYNGQLIDLQRKFNLKDIQMNWYEMKFKELREDLKMIQQEYPSEPEECFQASGGLLFPEVTLSSNLKWVNKFFQNYYMNLLKGHPKEGLNYVIGADPSGGTGNDDACLLIFCCETGEQVLEFSNNTIDPIKFATLLCTLGKLYNEAFLIPEGNNHGITVVSYLKENYNRIKIYKHKLGTAITQPKYGWQNSQQSKFALVGMIQDSLSEVTLYGKQTVIELKAFEEVKGRMEGKEDNAVIATGLAFIGLKKFSYLKGRHIPKPLVPKEPKNYMTYTLDEVLKNIGERNWGRGFFPPQVGQGYS